MAPSVPGQEVEAIKGQSNCTMTLKTPKNQGFRSTPLFLVQKKCNLNSGVVHPRALYLFFTFSLPNSVFAGGPAGFWRGLAVHGSATARPAAHIGSRRPTEIRTSPRCHLCHRPANRAASLRMCKWSGCNGSS